jgi:hypothetical protein
VCGTLFLTHNYSSTLVDIVPYKQENKPVEGHCTLHRTVLKPFLSSS